ncbi:IS3 family transposase [Ureibacillus endophyticus]|uniref:IS3 family transposase n=1 Tax=Ureibacillus endophyticus TaxID=1978490 RepID=A0A494ZA48_9BACL|nr:IS3 family transposase [Lysinibacillus endophyticus]RKQ18903.1 IS3 family transposase [Lysinibacillus endophyticus]
MAKSKFTDEQKLQAVMMYLNSTKSYREVAKELGMDYRKINQWVKRYEYNGVEAFVRPCTSYTQQFKLDVLNFMIENGTSLLETAAIFNIASPTSIFNWRNQLEEQGLVAFQLETKERSSMNKKINEKNKDSVTEVSVEELQAELQQLRMEVKYLKKPECLSSTQNIITNQDKAQIVYELRNEFPVKELLKRADLPRSTYYYHVKQMGKPDPDADLKREIKAIFDEHEGRYGYRRIRDELRNRRQKVNHKKVQRIMKELGLKCLVRMKKYRSYKGTVGKIAPNHLNREFTAEQPNEKWVTDITEFKLFGEKLYFSPVLDLFNGEIITYTIGPRPTYSLVSDMLDQALERLPEDHQLLMHSDQGWHYQMKQYRETLQEKGITQSMSRKGNCYDNSVMENFFGIMKSEILYLKEFESIEHFKLELEKYIEYYNNKRIKAKLKGMSPVQYRTHTQYAA